MMAHSLFFYLFSTIAVFSAVMVTISRNTVYSVFFLILVFVTISILFIMIGAITLTFTKRENIKRQSYFDQIQREKSTSIKLVDVENDKGVKLDE